MTAWHVGMLALLPLMGSWPKGRTWAALMFAGVVPWLLLPMSIPAYIAIDAVAGAVVLRHPANCAQRAIGACFAMLVMFHVGFLLAPVHGNTDMYYQANVITGWLQLGLLFIWGVADAGKTVLYRGRTRRGLSAIDAGIR